MSAKVVFAGTSEFALPSLEALASHAGVEVVAVYTQPDRPAGRGRKLTPSPVKTLATALDIPVCQPHHLDTGDAGETLSRLEPDLVVVTAYGLILPPTILAIPARGCVNVHGSLLPRWRGAAPVQRAIEAGDAVTGVSLMRMEAGLDDGPVYARSEVAVDARDTGGTLQAKLATAGGQLLRDHLDGILEETLPAVDQDPGQVTYAAKFSPEEARIHWNGFAVDIARRIRAFNPWPMASTSFRGKRLRLLMAWEEPGIGAEGAPGEVLSTDAEGIVIACGRGAIRVARLQSAGARAMEARDFLNGTGISAGERLG